MNAAALRITLIRRVEFINRMQDVKLTLIIKTSRPIKMFLMNSLRRCAWGKSKVRWTLLIFALFSSLGSMRVFASEDNPASAPDGVFSTLSSLNLNGSLRGSYWNVSNKPYGDNNLVIGELWLKAAPQLGDNAKLLFEGWTRTPNALKSTGEQSSLREGFVSFSSSAVDFRIGKQIIAWGRADQLNPTDNLSPHDYSMLSTEIDDQRQGSSAVKATYNFTNMAATGIWLPDFSPNTLPIPPSTGTIYSESTPSGDQFALKLEQSGLAVDWSLSYFRGFDLNPDIAIQSVLPEAVNLSLQHHRIHVLGADASTVIGRYGLRTEAAYTWTESTAGIDPFVKKPFFYGVVGSDRTFFEYLNINLQYFMRQINDFNDPNTIADPLTRYVAIQQSIISNQQDKFQQGISLRIGNKWLNETLEAEFAAVYSFTRRDYLLRPKLSYAFDDHWKGALVANLYRGDANTFFGMLNYLSNVSGELCYNF